MPKKYTINIHAQRLQKMLDHGANPKADRKTCEMCPAGAYFNAADFDQWKVEIDEVALKHDKYPTNNICKVCRQFIGLSEYSKGYDHCPCYVLGKQQAIDRANAALMAYYKKQAKVKR